MSAFNFGSSGTGFKLGGTTTPSTTSTTGSTGFSFGGFGNSNQSNTATTTNQTSTTTTGSNFGFGSSTSTTNPTTGLGISTSTTTPASTGFSLGQTTGTTSTTQPASTGFSLSGSTTTPATTGLSLGGSTATPATTTTSGFSLSGLSTQSKPTTTLGSSFGTTNNTTTPANSTLTAPTQSSTNPPISFKVLEDYINKWMGDLDAQEKDFLNQATQLNALDKLMIENGEKIIDLSNEVTRLSNDQDQLEQELNFVHSQQDDLEKAIKKLEVGIEQMPLIPQQTSDTSRIEMYKLLIEVDNQLKSMSIDLREVIKRLNDTNVNLNDPIVQISKILNAHMDSLNWIEENTGLIQNQVDTLSKVVDDRLKETDRNESFSRYLYLK